MTRQTFGLICDCVYTYTEQLKFSIAEFLINCKGGWGGLIGKKKKIDCQRANFIPLSAKILLYKERGPRYLASLKLLIQLIFNLSHPPLIVLSTIFKA